VPIDGVRVLGRSGPPVLLLPGGAESCDGFFPGLPEGLVADPGARVVEHDRPGTGTSPADGLLADAAAHLGAVVDELGCGPVVVVGQSLGGAVAALLARDRPDVVAGLVLLDPTPINDPTACGRLELTTGLIGRYRPLHRPLAAALRAASARQRRRLRMRPDCAAAHARLDDVDLAQLARSVRGIAALSTGFHESDLPRVPAVVVTADRRTMHPIRRAHARLAAALAAPLVSWPGATHTLHLDHPDETLALVRGFVRDVAGPGG
jgi:pimeloyl-ACP methyl ester carboxylesterase